MAKFYDDDYHQDHYEGIEEEGNVTQKDQERKCSSWKKAEEKREEIKWHFYSNPFLKARI